MMHTKDELLFLTPTIEHNGIIFHSSNGVKRVMDEWAEQDSLCFMRWCFDHNWIANSEFLWWNTELPKEDVRFHRLSEIYKTYRQSVHP